MQISSTYLPNVSEAHSMVTEDSLEMKKQEQNASIKKILKRKLDQADSEQKEVDVLDSDRALKQRKKKKISFKKQIVRLEFNTQELLPPTFESLTSSQSSSQNSEQEAISIPEDQAQENDKTSKKRYPRPIPRRAEDQRQTQWIDMDKEERDWLKRQFLSIYPIIPYEKLKKKDRDLLISFTSDTLISYLRDSKKRSVFQEKGIEGLKKVLKKSLSNYNTAKDIDWDTCKLIYKVPASQPNPIPTKNSFTVHILPPEDFKSFTEGVFRILDHDSTLQKLETIASRPLLT